MRHPIEYIQPKNRKHPFTFLLIMTILMMVIMVLIGLPLMTPAAPSGVVSFEFAFSPTNAQQIISSWDAEAQLRAAFIQGLDFLFPVVYSAALGLGCMLAANVLRARGNPLVNSGITLAWALLLAALCDYIENISLITVLSGVPRSPFPEIAGICAVIKFTIIILAICYIIYAWIIRLIPSKATQSAT